MRFKLISQFQHLRRAHGARNVSGSGSISFQSCRRCLSVCGLDSLRALTRAAILSEGLRQIAEVVHKVMIARNAHLHHSQCMLSASQSVE